MNFFAVICFLTLWSFNHGEPAFFFDWEEIIIVEINKYYDGEAICYSCISACPARSDSKNEKLFNAKVSVTKNELFVRNYYAMPIAAKEMETEICENPYNPALAYDNALHSYDVGYELYYEKGRIELTSLWYDFYVKVVDGKKFASVKRPLNPNVIKKYKNGDNTEFQIVAEPNTIFVFYWFNVLSFEIPDDQNHRLVSFVKDTINDFFNIHRTVNYCEFYYSGDGRKILDKNSDNRDAKADIQTFDKNSPRSKEPEKIINHLVKTQIIPMHMFHTVAGRLTTCMYLNFAFVWKTIANNQLNEIDFFLYAIHREWPSDVYISFGVNGVLQNIHPTARNEIASEDHLFRKFPVPAVIFRFVEIYLKNYQLYGAIIVIHNDLRPIKDDDRICLAKDELKSWDYVKNTNSATGFSYVCPYTSAVLEKLNAEEKLEIEFMKPLKIDEFPQLAQNSGHISQENVLDRIKRRLDDIKTMKNLRMPWPSNHPTNVQPKLNKALFFNWKQDKLTEIPKNEAEMQCSYCLSACPMSSNSFLEKILNENASLTGSGIFLRNIYDDAATHVEQIESDICENPLIPALVWDKTTKSYEIGYELYYKNNETVQELKSEKYENFYEVINGDPNLKQKKPSNENLVKIQNNAAGTEFRIIGSPVKIMKFYWIKVLKIEVSSKGSEGNHRMVTFVNDTMKEYFHKPRTTYYCKVHYSGDDRKVVDKSNKISDQEAEDDDEVIGEEVEVNEGQSKKVANHLVKTQIIPMLMFHTYSARIATCMYLNFVYVWGRIANERLKKIDLFLYAIYRKFSDLKISFGVNGDLQSKGILRFEKYSKIAFDDDLFHKYPIPQIIYRVIGYKLKGRKDLYTAVIIIHNELDTVQNEDRICPSELEGWEYVNNVDAANGTTYACSMTPEVLKKLGFIEQPRLENTKPLRFDKFLQSYATNLQKMYYDEKLAELKIVD